MGAYVTTQYKNLVRSTHEVGTHFITHFACRFHWSQDGGHVNAVRQVYTPHTHTNQPFLCVIGIMSKHRDEDDVLCVFLCDEMGKKERTGIFGFIP